MSHDNPLDVQVDGDHYKKFKIQPVEYIHANDIPFIPGAIIKYASRAGHKGGREGMRKDIEKIKHFCDLWLRMERLNDRIEVLTIPEATVTVEEALSWDRYKCKNCGHWYPSCSCTRIGHEPDYQPSAVR